MKQTFFILFFTLLAASPLLAQTGKTVINKKLSIYQSITDFFYDQSDCFYTQGKYTLEELKNTEIIASEAISWSINWPKFITREENMTNEQYNEKVKTYIRSCVLVKGDFWEKVRQEILRKFDYRIEREQLELDAIKDPKTLKNSKYAKYCKEYVDMLNGTDSHLMASWKSFIIKQAKQNADPQKVMQDFRKKAATPNWVEYARKELVTYGAMNAINNYDKEFYTINTDEVTKAFRKLFVRIDEPEP